MKTYSIYSARLQYNQYNKKLGEIQAYDLKHCKELIKKPVSEGGFFINPFYAVIIDEECGANIILHNKHLDVVKAKTNNK